MGLEARSGAFKGTAFTSLDTVADGQAQQMGASWGKQDWESRGRGGERMEGKGSGWLEGGQGLGGQGQRSRVSSVCRQWDLLVPLSSPRPSLALSCGASLLFLCLQLCRGLGLLGHLRTFSASQSDWEREASLIPQRFVLLDPSRPYRWEPFCSPLHVSLAPPACPELLAGPRRDLDSTPDLNI